MIWKCLSVVYYKFGKVSQVGASFEAVCTACADYGSGQLFVATAELAFAVVVAYGFMVIEEGR